MTSDEIRQRLEGVLAAGGIARFTYSDSKGRISERRVAPVSVSETHFAGTDLDQRAYRSFRIDRVQELDETPPIHPARGYHATPIDGPLELPAEPYRRPVAPIHQPQQARNEITLAYLDPAGLPRAYARGPADKRDEVRRLAAAHLGTYLAEKRAAGDPLATARFRLHEIDESGAPVDRCAWCGRPHEYADVFVEATSKSTVFCKCQRCHDCREPHGPDGEGLMLASSHEDAERYGDVGRCDRCWAVAKGAGHG